MKIVLVAPRFPYPLDKGDRLTIFHLLQYLSARHEVAFACFLEEGQDPAWVEKIQPFCKAIELVRLDRRRAMFNSATGVLGRTPLQVHYYRDPAMQRAVQRLVDQFQPDLLYAHTIRMGQYIESFTQRPRVLAMQIAMTLNYARLAAHASTPWSKLFFSLEHRKVRSFETDYARQFDKVLLISPHDLKGLHNGHMLDNVFFSPHGVDFTYFAPDEQADKVAHSIIMTGNMNYAPNVDAVTYFSTEIWPRVRQVFDTAQLWLVGADPTPQVQALAAQPGIQVTGRVPDLRPYQNRAELAVAPLRIGAGLQNKVLEGMSMGLPMVITGVANEGIQAVDGEQVLVADDAPAFADAVIRLLQSPELRQRLGQAARNFIIQQWSWEKHFRDLDQMFSELVQQAALR